MFFLLVFFILSSVGALKLQGINIEIPKQGQGQVSEDLSKDRPLEFTVAIQPNGQMSVNNKVVPAGTTIAKLIEEEAIKVKNLFDDDTEKLEAELKRATVVVSADPKATHEMVIRAIDEARQLRGKDGKVLISQFGIANSAAEPGAAPAAN